MLRRFIALGVLAVVVMGVAGPALAKPKDPCPGPWTQVDGEGWWAATVAGIEEEGLTVEGVAEMFGFDDIDAFKAWVIEGVMNPAVGGLDKNGNGFICMKDAPTPPFLGYLIKPRDDKV